MSTARPDTATLVLEVRRLADRLRALPQSRLEVRLDGGQTRATLAHALAQHLADAAAGVDARSAEVAPPARAVPVLTVFAVGDQVAVTGADLAAALRGVDVSTPVWTAAGARGTAQDTLAAALDALRAVRAIA